MRKSSSSFVLILYGIFRSVSVEVKIKDGDGVHYVYKKNLPVDIIPENSEYKVKANIESTTFQQI